MSDYQVAVHRCNELRAKIAHYDRLYDETMKFKTVEAPHWAQHWKRTADRCRRELELLLDNMPPKPKGAETYLRGAA